MRINTTAIIIFILALLCYWSFRNLPHMLVCSMESPEKKLVDITPKQAYDLIMCNMGNPDFIILDIRTPNEYSSGHIERAELLDFYSDSFQQELDELEKTRAYLIYCRSGNRTGTAMKMMQSLGFTEVYNMLGGIGRWAREGYPVIISD